MQLQSGHFGHLEGLQLGHLLEENKEKTLRLHPRIFLKLSLNSNAFEKFSDSLNFVTFYQSFNLKTSMQSPGILCDRRTWWGA